MGSDADTILQEIKETTSKILDKDISKIKGFSERQLKALSQHSILVASGIASGEITDETKDFFLDNLKQMTLNFVRTLRGIIQVTIEKVWNAIVKIIWDSIEKITGTILSPAKWCADK